MRFRCWNSRGIGRRGEAGLNADVDGLRQILMAGPHESHDQFRQGIPFLLHPAPLPFVTRHWVSDLERGHTRMPDWDCICYVAAALQTDPNTLLGWDEFQKVIRS